MEKQLSDAARTKGKRYDSTVCFQQRKRDRYELPDMTLDYKLFYNPPWIDQVLAFTIKEEMEKIAELTPKIMAAGDEAENCTQELSKMVKEDPRLGDGLKDGLVKTLVEFLGYKHNQKLQHHAAIALRQIVAHSKNRNVVMEHITIPIIADLICSEDGDVQKQVLVLLLNILRTTPDSPKTKSILEQALEPLISLLVKSTVHDVLHCGIKSLAVACQVYPELCPNKLKSALPVFKRLIKYKSVHKTGNIVRYACSGFAFLCDGSKQMLLEFDCLGDIIDRLIDLIDSKYSDKSISGLIAMGSIVRWGVDRHIEFILQTDTLESLEYLLDEKDTNYVKNACWIISNITAHSKDHIQEVIDCKIIEALVRVVEKYELTDVKIEAAYAISNAIFGADLEQIRFLQDKCRKAFWNLLKIPSNDEVVTLCLEVLIKLKALTITFFGEPINGSQWFKILKKYLNGSEDANELSGDIIELTKSKKLRIGDDFEKLEREKIFYITCETEINNMSEYVCLSYNDLEKHLKYVVSPFEMLADM